MEILENNLFEAAAEGNVNSLKKLLQEDPIILDRVIVNNFSDTPVHVAAILGHVDFVREILGRKPEFTRELNTRLSSPLHLASAKGHSEVVRVLLSANSQMCLARDRNGLTPLHLAAIKGRIDVVKELVRAKPDAALVTVDRGQSILHLCVKYYQLEALKLLVQTIGDQEFTNSKDSDGNTILHLGVADKQIETVDFLLKVSATEVNARNLSGMTPMDILIRSRKDVRDEEIEESLKRGGALGSMQNNSSVHNNRYMASPGSHMFFDQPDLSSNIPKNSWKKMFKQHENWLEKKRSALMVVASLIATMAFQVGVNPPSGVWQETSSTPDSQGNPATDFHYAGFSILAHNYPKTYERFLIANTTGFIASLSIILLLMSGLPIRSRIFMWILMVITWIAITALALTYLASIIVLTPERERQKQSILFVIGFTVLIWLGLMALLLIAHTIRLIIKIVRKLIKSLSPKRRIPGQGFTSRGSV
ncbi:Ankyrin repeat family protein [Forsythia ovata]|uniref:Ankyrin repeat family protein n=1 Tax=Forsythia ovata TaxID=205694 RepID=A0ABD1W5Z6_9LAMI